MALPNKINARKAVLQLPVGGVLEFPIARVESIRAMVSVLQKKTKVKYVTKTTDEVVRVTCTNRPEQSNN